MTFALPIWRGISSSRALNTDGCAETGMLLFADNAVMADRFHDKHDWSLFWRLIGEVHAIYPSAN